MYKREVKEEVPNVYRFSEPMGTRLLSFYGIREESGWTLIDCGLPGSVASWIEKGTIDGAINRLIITHSDADHFGSGAWLKSTYPKLKIVCHSKDKKQIEDHKLIVKNRYDDARPFFGFGYPKETLDTLFAACGKDFKVDNTIGDDDMVSIAGNKWKVIHLPGHSPGHIGLVRPNDGVFIMGDAFLGEGPPDSRGIPSMPPTHENIPDYLKSIERAKNIEVGKILSGHWLPMDKEAFSILLDTSEKTVHRDINIIVSFLETGEKSFEEIIKELCKKVSTWEEEENDHYLYAVNGYLKHLGSLDKVVVKNQKIKLK